MARVRSSLDSLKAFMAGSDSGTSFEPRPGVIVVGSGKGGVGTSVVSALLALEAAKRGEHVLLVDADETVGSLHMMFGITDPGGGLGSLREPRVEPESLLRTVAPDVALFPGGGGGVDATLTFAAGERRALLRRVSGLYEQFSTVIVDGGSRLDSVMAACAVGTERLLCITVDDRISLAANYALFKVARTRFAPMPIDLLVNFSTDPRAFDVHALIHSAARHFLSRDIAFGGSVPEDLGLRAWMRDGGSLSALPSDAPVCGAVGAVMDRILEERGSSMPSSADSIPRIP